VDDPLPDDTWDQLIAINLSSVFHTTKAAAVHEGPGLGAHRQHRLGPRAGGSPFKAPYTASKHAVVGFSKAVALEVAEQGITCNALCPGYVRTPLVDKQVVDQAKVHNLPEERVIREVILAAQPTKRFIEAEVAAFAVFLCSEAARSVTGSAQLIDGAGPRGSPGKPRTWKSSSAACGTASSPGRRPAATPGGGAAGRHGAHRRILFRALGATRPARGAGRRTEHGARRGWLARIAHVGEKGRPRRAGRRNPASAGRDRAVPRAQPQP
jgi:hypothetical protein